MNKTLLLHIIIFFSFLQLAVAQKVHLNLKGADSISSSFIKKNKFNTIFKNTKELNNNLSQLKSQINNNGFFNYTTTPLIQANDSTYTLTLKLNNQYKYIQIDTKNQIAEADLKRIITSNSSITPNGFLSPTSALETNLNNIIYHFTQKGQLFSTAQLTNISINQDNISALLKLNKSTIQKITNYKIKGYSRFPKKFLKHYLRLKTNTPLNPDQIKAKSKDLNNLRFVEELKKPEILFTKDSTVVYLYLKKKKANAFDGFLGFASDPETQKIKFNGNINLQLINNLNSGEALHIKYISSENEQRTIDIKTKIPFILNSPISIEGQMNILKRDSTFTNTTQGIGINYQISRTIQAGLGYELLNSNYLLTNSSPDLDFKRNTYLLKFQYSTPHENQLFFYKTLLFTEFGIAQRQNSITTNQQSINFTGEHTFNLNPKNSIFIKNQSYYLISDTILENEFRFIGGINSIRGFQENSIPSALYSVLNTEYRILLNRTLYTHSVIDFALTQNSTSKEITNLIGIGIGFGLQSKNNLLRFIFANGKSPEEQFKFSNSKIHLSLKTFF